MQCTQCFTRHRRLRFSAALLTIALITLNYCAGVRAEENNMPPKGFTALFNGRDFKDWTGGSTRDPREVTALPPAEREKHDRKFRVVDLLERARELASDKDSPADVTDNLLRLVYFYQQTDQPHQAAVLGEHIARTVRSTGGKSAVAGLLALNGYVVASAGIKARAADANMAEAHSFGHQVSVECLRDDRFRSTSFSSLRARTRSRSSALAHSEVAGSCTRKWNCPRDSNCSISCVSTCWAHRRLAEGKYMSRLSSAQNCAGQTLSPAMSVACLRSAAASVSVLPSSASTLL